MSLQARTYSCSAPADRWRSVLQVLSGDFAYGYEDYQFLSGSSIAEFPAGTCTFVPTTTALASSKSNDFFCLDYFVHNVSQVDGFCSEICETYPRSTRPSGAAYKGMPTVSGVIGRSWGFSKRLKMTVKRTTSVHYR